jgi:hypothetical protein
VDPKKIEELKQRFAGDEQMLKFIEVLSHLFSGAPGPVKPGVPAGSATK